jgi:hypothetical protein
MREVAQTDAVERFERLRFALGARHAGELECVFDVRESAPPQQHRALEDHRLPAARGFRSGPADSAFRGRKQPMQQPHQHALSRSVRSQDDAAGTGLEFE